MAIHCLRERFDFCALTEQFRKFLFDYMYFIKEGKILGIETYFRDIQNHIRAPGSTNFESQSTLVHLGGRPPKTRDATPRDALIENYSSRAKF